MSSFHRQVEPENLLATVIATQETRDAINKGAVGAHALNALIELWSELKLGAVTGESLSQFRAVVDRMYTKSIAASRGRDIVSRFYTTIQYVFASRIHSKHIVS